MQLFVRKSLTASSLLAINYSVTLCKEFFRLNIIRTYGYIDGISYCKLLEVVRTTLT